MAEEPVVESADTAAGASNKPASPTLTEHVRNDLGGPAYVPRQEARQEVSWIAILAGAMFWPVSIGIIVYIFSQTFRTFLATYWWAFVIPLVCVLILGLLPAGRRALIKLPLPTRAALFIFILLPLLIALVGAAYYFSNADSLANIARLVFLVIVCILPAVMWYLFIVTRKASLLNEFLANLYRLGLLSLQERPDTAEYKESEPSRRRRIDSYLQKFEAVYGDLPHTTREQVLEDRYTPDSGGDTTATARSLSTAAFPVALYTVLIITGWLTTLPPFESPVVDSSAGSPWLRAFQPQTTPVTLAFLGAYFFSLQMLFRRYVRNDLGGPAYVAASIRIVLATIGIWSVEAFGPSKIAAVGKFTGEEFLLLGGFVFGVFPRVIWQIIQSLFRKAASFAVPSMRSQLPLSDLDGLTVWHETRLEEEDIENIPNMANADVVELMLNTPYPPEQIVDWVDQAILYTQLGPQETKRDDKPRQKLRIYGIRTATSLLWASAESRRQGKRDEFDKILTDGDSVMPVLEASLATNSNLELIRRWRQICDPLAPSGAVVKKAAA